MLGVLYSQPSRFLTVSFYVSVSISFYLFSSLFTQDGLGSEMFELALTAPTIRRQGSAALTLI